MKNKGHIKGPCPGWAKGAPRKWEKKPPHRLQTEWMAKKDEQDYVIHAISARILLYHTLNHLQLALIPDVMIPHSFKLCTKPSLAYLCRPLFHTVIHSQEQAGPTLPAFWRQGKCPKEKQTTTLNKKYIDFFKAGQLWIYDYYELFSVRPRPRMTSAEERGTRWL